MGAEEFNVAAYHKSLAEHKLMASRCTQCNTLFLPPRPICSHCQNQEMTWAELQGEGKIIGFSSIAITSNAMAGKGFGRNNPHMSALVELKEGPSIAARLEGVDPKNPEESVRVGMPVQADFLMEETVRVGLRGRASGRQVTLVFRPK